MTIRPFLKGATFDPEHVKAMGKAFDSVIRELQDTEQSRVVREVIAERIIALANVIPTSSANWQWTRLASDAQRSIGPQAAQPKSPQRKPPRCHFG